MYKKIWQQQGNHKSQSSSSGHILLTRGVLNELLHNNLHVILISNLSRPGANSIKTKNTHQNLTECLIVSKATC